MGWRKLLLVVTATGAALLFLETGVRLRVRYYGSEVDRIRYVYSAREIRQHQARFIGAPFLNYRLNPGYSTQNALGYRGPEIAVPKPAGVFRIVALGGSTTYGDQIVRWEDTYPAQLGTILRQRGHAVEVINAGVPGYSSWEMLIAFELQILDLQPDLVLVYEAINDLYPRLVRPSQYDGLATSKGLWTTGTQATPASALYRFVAIRLGWIEDPSSVQSQFDRGFSAEYCRFNSSFTRCENFGGSPDEVLGANPPKYFERNIRNLVAVARTNHVQMMLSSWAYYPFAIPDVSNGTFMTLPFVQQAVAEHNHIVSAVADAMQVPFYDFAALVPKERAFWFEGMHLTPAGAHAQAGLFADFLVMRGLVP